MFGKLERGLLEDFGGKELLFVVVFMVDETVELTVFITGGGVVVVVGGTGGSGGGGCGGWWW